MGGICSGRFGDSGHTGMAWAVAGMQGSSGMAYVSGHMYEGRIESIFLYIRNT